jgi:hypothetical protein
LTQQIEEKDKALTDLTKQAAGKDDMVQFLNTELSRYTLGMRVEGSLQNIHAHVSTPSNVDKIIAQQYGSGSASRDQLEEEHWLSGSPPGQPEVPDFGATVGKGRLSASGAVTFGATPTSVAHKYTPSSAARVSSYSTYASKLPVSEPLFPGTGAAGVAGRTRISPGTHVSSYFPVDHDMDQDADLTRPLNDDPTATGMDMHSRMRSLQKGLGNLGLTGEVDINYVDLGQLNDSELNLDRRELGLSGRGVSGPSSSRRGGAAAGRTTMRSMS